MKLAIIGQGYVGTSLGLAAMQKGHEVIGIDNSTKRVLELKEIGYAVTCEIERISDADIVVIAVPTPLDENRQPDLSYLIDASQEIKKHAKKGTLIVNESTSYPGTLRNLISPILGPDYHLAVAPERIDPSNSEWTIENTPRVIGALTMKALDLSVFFYSTIATKIFTVSSPEVAEAAKLFENTFRQVNIAFVNEFSQIAKALNIPTVETLEAAATKPFGFMSFMPGVGVGGHCIPIDPVYLSHAAKKVGYEARFINLADEVNGQMPDFIIRKLQESVKLENKVVQIAGIAYKSNTNDVRESPAIKLIQLLRNSGASVIWNDDLVKIYENESSAKLQKVDVGIVCTHHDYMNFSPWLNSGTRIIDVSTSKNSGLVKFL